MAMRLEICCRKGDPFQGPKSGLLPNTRKRIVQGDMLADKARDFIGKGRPSREQEGMGTQRTALPHGSQSWVLW